MRTRTNFVFCGSHPMGPWTCLGLMTPRGAALSGPGCPRSSGRAILLREAGSSARMRLDLTGPTRAYTRLEGLAHRDAGGVECLMMAQGVEQLDEVLAGMNGSRSAWSLHNPSWAD